MREAYFFPLLLVDLPLVDLLLEEGAFCVM